MSDSLSPLDRLDAIAEIAAALPDAVNIYQRNATGERVRIDKPTEPTSLRKA